MLFWPLLLAGAVWFSVQHMNSLPAIQNALTLFLNGQPLALAAYSRAAALIMCVLFTEDVGGILELVFDEDGCLQFRTSCEENDFFYDEIGSALKIKQYQNEKIDLLEALETYYRVLYLGEGLDM